MSYQTPKKRLPSSQPELQFFSATSPEPEAPEIVRGLEISDGRKSPCEPSEKKFLVESNWIISPKLGGKSENNIENILWIYHPMIEF